MNSILCKFAVAAACILGFPHVASAAGKPSATVSGRVTYKGKPVAKGSISLHPAKGKPIVAAIKDGTFSFKAVHPGETRVTVTSKGLPKKYASTKTSGLKFHVGPEDNQLNIDLK